jgi:hypothetical protein
MTGIAMLNSSFGAAAPATLAYYLDASAQGAFPGASITTSASFNGTSQCLTLPASTNWAFGTGDFTIEWWQYMSATQNSFPRVFSVGSNPTTSIAVSIEGGTFYFWENGSFTFSSILSGYSTTWVHFAISRVSGQTSVYQNGTKLGSTFSDTNNITDSSSTLAIGTESTPTADTYYTGYISNFRIIKGTGIYTANFSTPTVTLRAITNTALLLPLTAAPFMDISTNLLTVTNTGTVTTTASAPSLTAATTDVTGNYALSYSNTSGRISWASTQGGVFRNTFSGDGINAYITGGPDWSTSRSYTVFMGYKLTGTSNYGRLLNSNTGTPDWLMGGYSSKSKAYFANGTTINLAGPTDTTWHLDWARFNKNTSVGDLFSVTTAQPTSTPAYTATNSAIGAFNQLKLFSKSDGNECAAGDIAFVRIWDGAMTTAQMQAEWAAFHARVGF